MSARPLSPTLRVHKTTDPTKLLQPHKSRKERSVMFGRMMTTPILPVGANADLQTAISSLLRAAEQPDVARWIEFPHSVLLFLVVPGDRESGAV